MRGEPASQPLSDQEMAVLRVLLESRGRVVGRRELARRIGLTAVNDRRCDSLLVGIRRQLGSDSIRTVRSRGWILSDHAIEAAHRAITLPKHSQD